MATNNWKTRQEKPKHRAIDVIGRAGRQQQLTSRLYSAIFDDRDPSDVLVLGGRRDLGDDSVQLFQALVKKIGGTASVETVEVEGKQIDKLRVEGPNAASLKFLQQHFRVRAEHVLGVGDDDTHPRRGRAVPFRMTKSQLISFHALATLFLLFKFLRESRATSGTLDRFTVGHILVEALTQLRDLLGRTA